MKPEAACFLATAEDQIRRAEIMLGADLNEDAGRAAYLAAFHAAQAYLFQTCDRVFKKHASVRGEFGRLIKDEPRLEHELKGFLSDGYKFKAIADYDTNPDAYVSPEDARDAAATARRFVAAVRALLPPDEGA